MRTIVVGGAGFLGAALVDELLSRGDSVVVLERSGSQASCDLRHGPGRVRFVGGDILDPASLERGFAGADEVYNMAGRLGTSELDERVLDAIESNIVGAVNVFEAALAAGVPTVFYPSKPNVWLNAYTITKVASEQFAALYAANHPIRICSLRYFNAYGPHQHWTPIRKIIPAFAREAARGLPLTVYGDGEQTVDMIHSADIARITVDLVRSGYSGPPLDCGRGLELTVNEVARDVNAALGNAAGLRHEPMRRGETPGTKLVADVGPLRAAIGDLRFLDWTKSLAATAAWYADGVAVEDGRVAATAGG